MRALNDVPRQLDADMRSVACPGTGEEVAARLRETVDQLVVVVEHVARATRMAFGELRAHAPCDVSHHVEHRYFAHGDREGASGGIIMRLGAVSLTRTRLCTMQVCL